MEDSPLVLKYDFTPIPLPLYASAENQATIIDLEVMISKRDTASVSVQSLTITIPMGNDIGGDLSTGSLPSPTCNNPSWTIQPSGDVFQLTTSESDFGTDSLVILFSGITVNHQPGTVAISIAENVNGATNNDATTYTLNKLPPLTPVTDLLATPASILVNHTSTVTWQTADTGAYGFNVKIAGPDGYAWSSCSGDTGCLSATDGVNGVTTPAFMGAGSYTITLDVYQTDRLPYSPTIPLLVTAPTILRYECSLTGWLGGYRYVFQWATVDAARCALYDDLGHLLFDNLPLNTDPGGYIVWRDPSWPTSLVFELRAYDAGGVTHDRFDFDPSAPGYRTYTPATPPPLDQPRIPLAGSLDSQFFFAGFTPQPVQISIADPTHASRLGSEGPSGLNDVAVDPQWGIAYFVGYSNQDAAIWTMSPGSTAQTWDTCTLGPGAAYSIYIGNNSSSAYVTDSTTSFYQISLDQSQPDVETLLLPVAVKGAVILSISVYAQDKSNIYLLSDWSIDQTYPCPLAPGDLPKLKLVENDPATLYAFAQAALKKVDATSGAVTSLAMPGNPFDMDIVGNYAYITTVGQNAVSIVDLEKFVLLPTTIPVPDQPLDIAVAPDGQSLAVRTGSGSSAQIVIFPAQGILNPSKAKP
jgi:hypothetical protein